MATKPSTLPRWADVGGDIVEPTSGKKDVGWVASEKPPAQYDNWFKNLVFQWCDYLDDGDFTGPATFAGTVAFNDPVTVNDTIALNANVTTGITLASNQDVTVAGTGDYLHGSFTRTFVPLVTYSTGTWTFGATGWLDNGSNNICHVALPGFRANDRITGIGLYHKGDAVCDITVIPFIYTINAAGDPTRTDLDAGTTFNNLSSTSSVTALGLTATTLTANDVLMLEFDPNATGYSIGLITVTYTHV